MLAPRALRAGRLDAGRRSVYFPSDTQLARGIRLAQDLPALMPAAWLAANPEAAVPALNVQRVSRFND